MKKIFTFIAAMLMALAVNAATVNINPGTATLQTAVAAAAAGDVIVLADGTYDEAGDYITLNKNIEIKAAEGAHPVVLVKTYVKIQGGSKIKIEGIKFDGAQQGTYSHFFRVYDNAANYLELEGCELCNNANMFIKVEADKHIDSIKINNCYFHDGTNNAIRCYKTSGATNTCDKLVITNSTFANFAVPDYGCIQVENVGNAVTADIKVIVDHCTFYNIIKPANNTYGVIDIRKSTDNTINNCIFMNPATLPDGKYAHRASQLYGGTVSNCLVYNTPGHRTDDITVNNPVNLDPFFVDAANGDYTLSLGEGGNNSPALRAGVNGECLGDPRWWPTFNVRGTMNNWSATDDQMEWAEANHIYYKQIDLAAGSYEFKINHGAWLADWGPANIAGGLGDVALSDVNGNIGMTTDGRPIIVYFDLANNVVWADYLYPKVMVVGDFTEPAWQGILMDDENALSCHITITVPEGRWEFKIIDNNVWYGANGDVDRTNCTDWTLFKEGDQGYDPSINTGLLADIPGDYVLTYTYATKKLDITYPTSFTRNAANDDYQTLCVPFNASITNAQIFDFVGVANGAVTIQEIDPALLTAGKSYIVKPSGNMEITKVGEGQVSNPIFPAGAGLYGVLGAAYTYDYSKESVKTEPWINNFVLIAEDNLFHEIVSGGKATIKSTRAYLHLAAPIQAPSLRIIEAENGATNIQNVEGNEAAVKFIKNGQLYIQKDGVVYTAAGVAVK